MADFMADLNGIYGNKQVANQNIKIEKKGDNTKLDMTDFIQLMITQLTNQGIDESVDTSDMLNQMIQMQMVETMANLTDASIMSYAASLVGKEVTVGKFDSEGNLQEIVGTVTGTETGLNVRSGPGTTYAAVGGLRDGAQVIVLSQQEGWYQILFRNPEGQAAIGYVSADYLVVKG